MTTEPSIRPRIEVHRGFYVITLEGSRELVPEARAWVNWRGVWRSSSDVCGQDMQIYVHRDEVENPIFVGIYPCCQHPPGPKPLWSSSYWIIEEQGEVTLVPVSCTGRS